MEEKVPKLGGYPYGVRSKDGKLVLRFHPKSPLALRPDKIIFTITLNDDDIEVLQYILSKKKG